MLGKSMKNHGGLLGDGMFLWDLGWDFSEIVHGHSLMIDGILVPI
jgi:hypothetical protein